LNGWIGKSLSAALNRWFHQFQNLEELHLPQTTVTVPCFVGICQTIQDKTTFKCLGVDYADIKPVRGFGGRADLVAVLSNNPEMRLICTTTYAVLTEKLGLQPFWEQGRCLICDIPHAMRALPEIYGQADFFRPATS
jgi:hypothetical protein